MKTQNTNSSQGSVLARVARQGTSALGGSQCPHEGWEGWEKELQLSPQSGF